MTIDLHPADLGRVRLEITVEGAVVHVAMNAEHGATSAMLRDALPELHASLGTAGLTAGRVGLAGDSSTTDGRSNLAGRFGQNGGLFAREQSNQNGSGRRPWASGTTTADDRTSARTNVSPIPSRYDSRTDRGHRSIDLVL